jgi:hypothetical protein
VLLSSALDGGEWQIHGLVGVPRVSPFGTHRLGISVVPGTGLDSIEKGRFSLYRYCNPDRPTCSLQLYRLSHSDS